jgi:hypothetical protein
MAMELAGLYLNKGRDKGNVISDGDLSPIPLVALPAGQRVLLVGIRGRADLARTINAGSTVIATDGGAIGPTCLNVVTLVCDDKTDTACSVAVAVPEGSFANLQAAAAKLQLMVVNK